MNPPSARLLFSSINGVASPGLPFGCSGVGRHQRGGRSPLVDHCAIGRGHVFLIPDVIYDRCMSRPAPQPESIEVEATIVTQEMVAVAGASPPRLSQNMHGFWGYFTTSYLTTKVPTATTVLKPLPIALIPFTHQQTEEKLIWACSAGD